MKYLIKITYSNGKEYIYKCNQYDFNEIPFKNTLTLYGSTIRTMLINLKYVTNIEIVNEVEEWKT